MGTKTYLVTGGAGFIGSNLVLKIRKRREARIVNLDLLTYAGNLWNLQELKDDSDHIFVRGNIGDRELVYDLLRSYKPCSVVNLAAESHVDRSILGPEEFVRTNIVGTFRLLDIVLQYWKELPSKEKEQFRFLHVSTDEVYGSLKPDDPPFNERTPYAPNSPYSASKAASDHLVRAYHSTYGLPTIVTNCSNNYGPRQFPEKLIPLMILNAMNGKPLPIYGDGHNIRDWLYVDDHCEALCAVLMSGKPGETYNIGGRCEKTNIQVVEMICKILDNLFPESPYKPHKNLITFVKDRPGHDRRYAIDTGKIEKELGWTPREDFESGIEKTIRWYVANKAWVNSVLSGEYKRWVTQLYEGKV